MTDNPGTYAEIDCDVIHVTEKAVLIDPVGDSNKDHYKWIPISLLDPEFDPDEEISKGDDQAIWVARWFLKKEGII